MDLQDILSRRVDDLRADVATHVSTIRQRLDATDRRLDTLERRIERPAAPLGGQTEWWWWFPALLTGAAWILIIVIILRAARPC